MDLAAPTGPTALAAHAWLDVNHAGGLDLDQLVEVLDLQEYVSVGLRCDFGCQWWECLRGFQADLLYLGGADVEHLAEGKMYEHRLYAMPRWGTLEKQHAAALQAWNNRMRRRSGLG